MAICLGCGQGQNDPTYSSPTAMVHPVGGAPAGGGGAGGGGGGGGGTAPADTGGSSQCQTTGNTLHLHASPTGTIWTGDLDFTEQGIWRAGLTSSGGSPNNAVFISIDPPNPSNIRWTLDFGALFGQRLAIGDYNPAGSAGGNSVTAKLAIGGRTACNGSGRFHVDALTINPDGTLGNLIASFLYTCPANPTTDWLQGCVHFAHFTP